MMNPIKLLRHVKYPRVLHRVLKIIIILNLFDGVMTLFWVETGLAQESNILLRDLAHNKPVTFVLVKTSLVSLGALFLWRYRTSVTAGAGIALALLAYQTVFLYHLVFAGYYLGLIP